MEVTRPNAVKACNDKQAEASNKTFVCRLCLGNNIKLEFFKEHSQRCFEITKLKEELKHINDWLIKECERAKILKNNVGFDLLIAKKLTKVGTESIEDAQKSIELKLEAEKRAHEVVKGIYKNKFYNSKNKKCPTTGDFSSVLKANQANFEERNKTIFKEEALTTQPQSINRSSADSNPNRKSSEKLDAQKMEDTDGSLNQLSGEETEIVIKENKGHTKPSRFMEKYKKPSVTIEVVKESGEHYSKISEEKSKKSLNDVCVGDLLGLDDDNKEPTNERLSPPKISKEVKSQELQEAPEIIDDMFSDKSSAKESKKSQFAQLVSSKIVEASNNGTFEPKTENHEDQGASPKQNDEKFINQPRENPFSGSNWVNPALEVQETRSERIVDNTQAETSPQNHPYMAAQAHRIRKKSKFSDLRGQKALFSTQIFGSGKKIEEEGTKDTAVSNSDLARYIEMSKVCNQFFENLGK